jgi:RHS repeat-associated protein
VRQLAYVSGEVVLARAYDPYGVTAYASGASRSTYGFTGEYATNDLMYLRARFYVAGTGRFLSRDTWSGEDIHPIMHNFWLYAYANPIYYTDPSGHGAFPSDTWFNGLSFDTMNQIYGISFTDNFPWLAKYAVYDAVESVGKKLATLPSLNGSPDAAFRHVFYKGVNFKWDKKCDYCRPNSYNKDYYHPCRDKGDFGEKDPACKPTGGVTLGGDSIMFATLWLEQSDNEWGYKLWDNATERARNNVVHELGHVFNNLLGGLPVEAVKAAWNQTKGLECYYNENWPKRFDNSYSPYYGFASVYNNRTWQMDFVNSGDNIANEEFADMFLGWVFNRWEVNDFGNLTDAGKIRSEWMNQWMTAWIK